ncbi:NAD(+) kinase, partial [Elasticomyces elasticus]
MASSSASHGHMNSATNSGPDLSSSSSSPSLNFTPAAATTAATTTAVDPPLPRPQIRQVAARDHAASIDEVSQAVTINQSSNSNPSRVSAQQQQQQQQPRAEARIPSAPSSLLPLRSVVGYHHRNAFSTDSIPRQTIMKAIVSRPFLSSDNNPSGAGPRAASLRSFQNAYPSPPEDLEDQQSISVSSQGLASELDRLPTSAYLDRSLVLQSPCFFHQRFDDAVNIKKVLEEITGDDWLSHSRLVQTATG